VAALAGVALAVPAQAATTGQLSLPTTTSTVTVSMDGRSFPARLVQPTVAPAPGTTYPVVAFGHGFTQTASRYASTLTALAARGYVVVAPDSETGFFPNHGRFADDLWRSLRWVRATQPHASPTLDAVAGHSMGGGAALVAADRYPDIDTVMTLAAAETNPSATTAAGGTSVPALFVVGSRDTVVPPSTTRAIYTAKPSPASFVTITGGYHCGFNDSTSFFGLGCDSGSISRSTQLAITRELLGDWLDVQLRRATVTSSPGGTVTESK
jgi:pimeloyl-ACP methyl ester carboxylesterase